MTRKVVLAGHCGPDSSFLRSAVKSALGDVAFISADDNASLTAALKQEVDLVLLNRELGYGFEPSMGVDMIRQLRAAHPNLRLMLISNYAEVQAAAVAAGAHPGFGKREIGSPRVAQLLRDAVSAAPAKS